MTKHLISALTHVESHSNLLPVSAKRYGVVDAFVGQTYQHRGRATRSNVEVKAADLSPSRQGMAATSGRVLIGNSYLFYY